MTVDVDQNSKHKHISFDIKNEIRNIIQIWVTLPIWKTLKC